MALCMAAPVLPNGGVGTGLIQLGLPANFLHSVVPSSHAGVDKVYIWY